ncbi:MAG: hypothetical protein N2441_04525 [Rhodocyclaceae bacterium]|nr:hypothetical protein [Rhodocyclaceae bacterium]
MLLRFTYVLVRGMLLLLAPAVAAAQLGYPVAGLAPDARPAAAPRLTEPKPIDRKTALYGVSAPIPPSLRFLDHQGGWFNPFLAPGMTGPYDLRGWHAARTQGEPRP